jgi:hypothetical protein
LTPYRVAFTRPESGSVPSLLSEGVIYHHPERVETAVVWAENEDAIAEVLSYHNPNTWSDLTMLPTHTQR